MSTRGKRPPTDPTDGSSDEDPTKVDRPLGGAAGSTIEKAPRPEEPIRAISMKTPDPTHAGTGPIRAISMKTPSDSRPDAPVQTPAVPRPNLRAMSELGVTKPAQHLGHLAPPYDPNAARIRTMQDYVIWGCVAVIIASAIALVVWFAAR